MPTVPVYQRQMGQAGLGRVVEMPRPDASVFGGNQQGLADLGRAVGGVGQQMANVAIKERLDKLTADIDHDMQATKLEHNRVQNELRQNTLDQDAREIIPAKTREFLDSRRSELTDKYKGSGELAQKYLGRVFDSFYTDSYIGAENYAYSREKEFIRQTEDNKRQLAIMDAGNLENTRWREGLNDAVGSSEARFGANEALAAKTLEAGRVERRNAYESKAQSDVNQLGSGALELWAEPDKNEWGRHKNIPQDVQHAFKPEEYKSLRAGVEKAVGAATVDQAYASLSAMPPQKALAAASSPEWQKAWGITAAQGAQVAGMVYANWNHQKQMDKQQNDNYAENVATQALDLALGKNGQTADPATAYAIIKNSDLDGFTKSRALNLLEQGKLGKQKDPMTVSWLIDGVMNGSVNKADIHRAALLGSIDNQAQTDLVQLHTEVNGELEDVMKQWKDTVGRAYRGNMFRDATGVEAQAQTVAFNIGMEIIRQKARDGGSAKALDWVLSPDALKVIESARPDMQRALQSYLPRFGVGETQPVQEAPRELPGPASAAVRPTEEMREELSIRPGESLEAFQQRRKLMKAGGGK